MVHNRDKTHCKRGHEFTAENTYLQKIPDGRRCKKCTSLYNKKRYDELKRLYIEQHGGG